MLKIKAIFQTIKTYVSNKTLRWKIMTSIIAAVSAMSISLIITIRLDNYAFETLGDSYRSNEELNEFSHQLADTERTMETYIKYRTFESIDAYYSNQYKIETYRIMLQDNPSTDTVLQKEYIVKQLANSFVFYSGKAVAARRANNIDEQHVNYTKTLECYNILLTQISELNILFLEKNAKVYTENRENIYRTTTVSIIFIFLFFILILLLLYLLITSITKPLAEISEVANRLSDRDFDVPLFNRNTHDEIGNITRAFDRMIISIREYIDTIWEKALTETELKEKEIEMQALYADAQLKALQNQINPHFLFNTLNTGAQLAMMEGSDKTCYFLEQVADFFRYNIQQQKQTASIDEELGLVDNFIYIMKVRFGNRLEFEKFVPDHPFGEQLPAMTLQPLVENCIKHGLRNTKGKVTLKIEEIPGSIVISIADDGCGMPPEIRAQILESPVSGAAQLQPTTQTAGNGETEQHTGTGLINVYSRLRLYFHRNDVFDITANDNGQGTKFTIRIPDYV